MTHKEWLVLWSTLSEEQKERIRQKARWEGVTLLGVLEDWPTLFGMKEEVK